MASPKLKINRPLKNGKLVLSRKDELDIKALYDYHKDGDIMALSIQQFKETRTDRQRKYFFKCIVTPLCEQLWGETHKKALGKMNDFLKKNFNPEYYTTPEGVEDVIGLSIEKEKKDKVEKIYEQIRFWAADKGVVLYLPNEGPWEE